MELIYVEHQLSHQNVFTPKEKSDADIGVRFREFSFSIKLRFHWQREFDQ